MIKSNFIHNTYKSQVSVRLPLSGGLAIRRPSAKFIFAALEANARMLCYLNFLFFVRSLATQSFLDSFVLNRRI